MSDSIDELKKWVFQQPESSGSLLAVRLALRAFPNLIDHFLNSNDQTDTEIFLRHCRAILIAAVGTVKPNQKVKSAAVMAAFDVGDFNKVNLVSLASILVRNAAYSVGLKERDDRRNAVQNTLEFVTLGSALEHLQQEVRAITHGISTDVFYSRTLWRVDYSKVRVDNIRANFLKRTKVDLQDWSFWREWYQGFLDGKPMDWELQRRVALIGDADWEQGPAHIARVIEEIRARFELEKRIAELEVALTEATQSRHGIGGNNPPELISDTIPIAKELLIVWAPLQELRAEIEAEEPDKAKIRTAIEWLGSALKSGLMWIAKKGDLAVDTAIKWAVPVGGTGYLTMNPDKILEVIEAAKLWLNALP